MPVLTKTQDDLLIITIDNPHVNALSQSVRAGLLAAFRRTNSETDIKGLVLTGAGRLFCAGADIREFGKGPLEPSLPDVIMALENCRVPTIAAINGAALGGGLELALGCRYRIGVGAAKCGLPEVTLGLIPGAGGTQRLPRLIGALSAGDIIASGKPLSAKAALKMGILDALVEGDVVQAARDFLREKLAAGDTRPPLSRVFVTDWDEQAFVNLEAKTARRARGQLSPVKALVAVRAAHELPFAEGVKREREIFMELMASDQRAGLIHAFFAERQLGKLPELQGITPLSVTTVNILGAGTMGVGIALACLAGGYKVGLFDINPEALDKGLSRIRNTLDGQVKKGRIDRNDLDAQLSRLSALSDMEGAAQADLIIEAATENLDIKKSIFKDLDTKAPPETILASNTSYLDINLLAEQTRRPDKVIGTHFFSPAHIMKLLEVVRTESVSRQTLATVLAVGKSIGKVCVVSGVCDGFIGNRMLSAYRRQADYLLEDGAWPWEIDRVMRAFGFAMGPFEVSDLAGIDIGWHNRRRLDATRPKDERYVDFADRLYAMGRLGQKSGAGYYRYEPGDRTPHIDPVVKALIKEVRAEKGIIPREFSDADIRDRLLYALVGEGAKILDEGIAARPLDIDMVWLHGYGFPRYRGGPMFWADAQGLDKIVTRIKDFAKDDPQSWQISTWLNPA